MDTVAFATLCSIVTKYHIRRPRISRPSGSISRSSQQRAVQQHQAVALWLKKAARGNSHVCVATGMTMRAVGGCGRYPAQHPRLLRGGYERVTSSSEPRCGLLRRRAVRGVLERAPGGGASGCVRPRSLHRDFLSCDERTVLLLSRV